MKINIAKHLKNLSVVLSTVSASLYLTACSSAPTMSGIEKEVNAKVDEGVKTGTHITANIFMYIGIAAIVGGIAMAWLDPERKMKAGIGMAFGGAVVTALSIFAKTI